MDLTSITMPYYLSSIAIIFIFLAVHVNQLVFCNEKSFSRNSKIKFALFKDHRYHTLDATKIETAFVPTGKHCLLRCVKNRQCFSTNIAVVPAHNGNVLCELLSSDKYNSSESYGRNDHFHHYSILVSNCRQLLRLPYFNTLLCYR